MKYVIVERYGIECAVIFPEVVQHAEVVKPQSPGLVSAGFFWVSDNEVRVGGRSESLNMESRPKDAQAIRFSLQMMAKAACAQGVGL